MDLTGKKVKLHDMCLRDGMHPKRHQITVDEMVTVAKAMDEAGVPLTELSEATTKKLRDVLEPELPAVNPLDAWSRGGETASEIMTLYIMTTPSPM